MSRAAPPLLLLASAALVTCAPSVRTPSVNGIVKVVKARACPTRSECPAKEECGTGAECAAVGGAASRLGFIVDDDYVLTYVGTAVDDVHDVPFRVTVPAKGAVFKAKGVSRVPDTGLALLKVLGKMKPVYVFAEQRVETERTVHAFTEIKGGHLPLVRGVVAEMDDQSDAAVVHIVHNALVDKAGYGSPLFNNCGEVVGVVVPAPSDKVLAGQLAVSTVPAGWLENALTSDDQEENQQGGRELTLRGAPGGCPSERTQLVRAVRLEAFYWFLGLATVVAAVVIVRYFSPGKEKSGDGSEQAGSGTTQSKAEEAGASPPAGTDGGAK